MLTLSETDRWNDTEFKTDRWMTSTWCHLGIGRHIWSIKSFIKFYTNSLWQIFWDCDRKKLYCVQNKVNKPYNLSLKRQEEVIISRIRKGHSKFTHSYLLQGEQQPECIFCDCPLTIQHIFLECSDTFSARNLLFGNVKTMHDLFTMFDVNVLLQFLQECDFYNKI